MDILALSVGGLLALWLGAISFIDRRTLRIPDVLSLGLLATGLAFAAWQSQQWPTSHVVGASVGFLSLALLGEAFFRWRGREGLGLGDAKLFGASGAWLGWQALPFVLLLASIFGLFAALALQGGTRRDRRLAFGPHLCVSFFAVWVFGAPGLSPVWR